MASFVVMEPPQAADETDAQIVRDGFHFLAFLVPFLWFFWHRCWLEGLAALAVTILIGAAGTAGILPDTGGLLPVLSLLVAIFFGLEASALRLAALRRRGWREWGLIEADNHGDAETRYMAEAESRAETEPADTYSRPQPWAEPSTRPVLRRDNSSLGLLGFSERR